MIQLYTLEKVWKLSSQNLTLSQMPLQMNELLPDLGWKSWNDEARSEARELLCRVRKPSGLFVLAAALFNDQFRSPVLAERMCRELQNPKCETILWGRIGYNFDFEYRPLNYRLQNSFKFDSYSAPVNTEESFAKKETKKKDLIFSLGLALFAFPQLAGN